MKYVNLTPHAVSFANADGTTLFTVPPDGTVARVDSDPGHVGDLADGTPIFIDVWGGVVGLPDPVPGTVFIVSGLVLDRIDPARTDVVAPATGPKDNAVRNAAGHIVAVRGWKRPRADR